MRSRNFLISILLAVAFCGNTYAQRSQHSNETGWLLEVTFLKGAPPAYERVRWPESQTPGDWFGRFGKVAGWQLPAGAQPIRAVRIVPHLQGETVAVKVSVMRGEKFMDAEETVATYDLPENEKVTIELLKGFGVEPFEIRAFRSAPLLANPPASINKTISVEIVGIEPVASDMPEYKLTLRNLSQKTIDALRVEIVAGQRAVSSGMPQGLDGKPLMLAGETVQVRLLMRVTADRAGDAYAPVVPLQQQVVIKSVIFADGTTEGITERDMESGAGFQSVKFGRRIELQRALPLFAAALEPAATSSGGVKAFRLQLEALDVGISEAELGELQQRFPTRESRVLKPPVELGIHLMRKEMLDQLIRFESKPDEKDFRSWLIDARERYSRWLARLEAVDASQP
ncbi:MAG TPA: hypothetical protein VIF64_02040 [Pyrinomonadaceae bacterium]